MTNVWLLPAGTESAPDADTEDHLVRLSGDNAEIARVTAAGPEWLGSVPASSLGSLPAAGDGPTPIEDQEAQTAVQGAATALNQRGG